MAYNKNVSKSTTIRVDDQYVTLYFSFNMNPALRSYIEDAVARSFEDFDLKNE